VLIEFSVCLSTVRLEDRGIVMVERGTNLNEDNDYMCHFFECLVKAGGHFTV